ncbi:protein of unknown function [Xenorhabdus doucetiae]|uniref:Uncharacterized protein n=1 Tax=Xenorhabdus doucetiae TaxID=351671 RepID=A0A068QN25_9GAMM|nr:protein of unknown function [Xenorhabdus doucetiae]
MRLNSIAIFGSGTVINAIVNIRVDWTIAKIVNASLWVFCVDFICSSSLFLEEILLDGMMKTPNR